LRLLGKLQKRLNSRSFVRLLFNAAELIRHTTAYAIIIAIESKSIWIREDEMVIFDDLILFWWENEDLVEIAAQIPRDVTSLGHTPRVFRLHSNSWWYRHELVQWTSPNEPRACSNHPLEHADAVADKNEDQLIPNVQIRTKCQKDMTFTGFPSSTVERSGNWDQSIIWLNEWISQQPFGLRAVGQNIDFQNLALIILSCMPSMALSNGRCCTDRIQWFCDIHSLISALPFRMWSQYQPH
jgi:hypothetical protein